MFCLHTKHHIICLMFATKLMKKFAEKINDLSKSLTESAKYASYYFEFTLYNVKFFIILHLKLL